MTRRPPPARPIVRTMAKAAREGRMSRREFVALASVFGATSAGAWGLLGETPVARADETPVPGGTLRIGMQVMDLKDPRLFDWPEMANVARQFCEPLVRWEPDFTFSGRLAESWEVSDDATRYKLNLRQNAVWTNGDAFTAEDVVFNITRWCDTTVEGNSMATAMSALIDEETGQLAEGVVSAPDDHTVILELPKPDISLIPAMSDYPALIVHRSFDAAEGLAAAPLGTGPFELFEYEIGSRAIVEQRADGRWWGGEAFLDSIEFVDLGTDPAAIVSAFEADEIDLNDQSPADLIDLLDGLDLVRLEKETAQTIVARMNVRAAPYDDRRVRVALQRAVDNAAVLELGLAGRGIVGNDHHVGPMHPEHADVPAPPRDPEAARAMLAEAGQDGTAFELVSIDGDWQRTTADAVAGQLRDAGLNVERNIVPGATFWNNWTQYPFSVTDWGGRPLGVQVLALAYRSGQPWNETGYANPDFDAKLDEALGIFDADKRRVVMADLQRMLQEDGVIIQPFWRKMYLHHSPRLKGYERHQSREMHLDAAWLDDA